MISIIQHVSSCSDVARRPGSGQPWRRNPSFEPASDTLACSQTGFPWQRTTRWVSSRRRPFVRRDEWLQEEAKCMVIYTTIAALYAKICPQNLPNFYPGAPNSTAIIAWIFIRLHLANRRPLCDRFLRLSFVCYDKKIINNATDAMKAYRSA